MAAAVPSLKQGRTVTLSCVFPMCECCSLRSWFNRTEVWRVTDLTLIMQILDALSHFHYSKSSIADLRFKIEAVCCHMHSKGHSEQSNSYCESMTRCM